MDHRQFDDAIRALHRQLHLRRSATRRQGILAVIAVAFGGGAGAALARGRRPVGEGPCKGLKRPDNICTRDSECCTKVCNLDAGKANRDGLGRCRCKHAGESCTADRNCCQRRERPLACIEGVCGPPTPVKSCTPGNCAQGCCRAATCVPFANQTDASCGMKGAVCAPCNSGFQCVNGSCVPMPTPTPAPTPPPPACATSCTGGCCNGQTCVPYASQNTTTCGSGGAPCAACTAAPDPSCNSGTCQYA